MKFIVIALFSLLQAIVLANSCLQSDLQAKSSQVQGHYNAAASSYAAILDILRQQQQESKDGIDDIAQLSVISKHVTDLEHALLETLLSLPIEKAAIRVAEFALAEPAGEQPVEEDPVGDEPVEEAPTVSSNPIPSIIHNLVHRLGQLFELISGRFKLLGKNDIADERLLQLIAEASLVSDDIRTAVKDQYQAALEKCVDDFFPEVIFTL